MFTFVWRLKSETRAIGSKKLRISWNVFEAFGSFHQIFLQRVWKGCWHVTRHPNAPSSMIIFLGMFFDLFLPFSLNIPFIKANDLMGVKVALCNYTLRFLRTTTQWARETFQKQKGNNFLEAWEKSFYCQGGNRGNRRVRHVQMLWNRKTFSR